jgi:prepilin-type N-terminal cleavage/methylation domain-containing protein
MNVCLTTRAQPLVRLPREVHAAEVHAGVRVSRVTKGFTKPRGFAADRGFTLMEVILAMALSSLLLTTLWFAMDVNLRSYESGRMEVEQAQLARALFREFEGDLRGTLAVSPRVAAFGEMPPSGAVSPGAGGTASTESTTSDGFSSGETFDEQGPMSSTDQADLSVTGASQDQAQSPVDTASPTDSDGAKLPSDGAMLQPATGHFLGGLHFMELDVLRRERESAPTGVEDPSNVALDSAGELTRVRYYLSGFDPMLDRVVDPPAEQHVGVPLVDPPRDGLIREQLPWATRREVPMPDAMLELASSGFSGDFPTGGIAGPAQRPGFAQDMKTGASRQTSGSDQYRSLSEIVVPEVARMELSYYDGVLWSDQWNSQSRGGLPLAVSIQLVMRPEASKRSASGASRRDAAISETPGLGDPTEMEDWPTYRLMVHLPQAGSAREAFGLDDDSDALDTEEPSDEILPGGMAP